MVIKSLDRDEAVTDVVTADEVFDPFSERILGAARAEIVRYGLRRTSLDAIARAAGVGRATLFRRFPNRNRLLTALALREARAAIADVDQCLATVTDPEALLMAAVQAVLHHITGNDLVKRLLVSDPQDILPVASERGGPVLALGRDYIATHLRRLQEMGVVNVGDVEVTAELLARLVLSFALNPVSVLPLDDDERLAEVVARTVAPLMRSGHRQEP
jgi:AcrR family transcriptional regulator